MIQYNLLITIPLSDANRAGLPFNSYHFQMMKKLFLLLSLVAGFANAGPVYTPGSARISSPIATTTVHANNIPVSFSAVCPGGPYVLKWAFDSGTGPFTTATFYDSISINFITKLPVGRHSLIVISPCGWTGTTFDVVP